ncbi:RHS repeat-associated core domain-containing protein [Pseudomonas japonica]|uniref:RHS repeat-associated core domain-containing protein n=1 Tax=Pseudomonas japonica TaxID=256466 RepID=A0A239B2P2_9PSED|nr:RHS repeat-associated core domain-containing protein [Pseudomonas japonica]
MMDNHSALLSCNLQQTPLAVLVDRQRQSIAHGPYGHRSECPDLPGSGFNGQWREPETGWYLLGNGYRAYNPVLMRFNSPDSLSPFGRGGLNAYGYCLGDPVNRTDPDGHVPLLRLFTQLRKFLGRSARRITGSKGRPARQKALLDKRDSTSSAHSENLPAGPAVSGVMASEPNTSLPPGPVKGPVGLSNPSSHVQSPKGAPRTVPVFSASQVKLVKRLTPLGGSGSKTHAHLPDAVRDMIRRRNKALNADEVDTNPSSPL